MTKHGFKKVIEIRTLFEKQAQRHLADVERQRLEEEERLKEFHSKKQSAMSSSHGKAKVSAAEMQAARAHIHSLNREIDTQNTVVQKIQDEEDQKRQHLIKRSQEKKMIEILEGKRLKEVGRESDRREQHQLDEFAQRIR